MTWGITVGMSVATRGLIAWAAAFALLVGCDDGGSGSAQQGTLDQGAAADLGGDSLPDAATESHADAATELPDAELPDADLPDAEVEPQPDGGLPAMPWPVGAPGFFNIGYMTEEITYQPSFGEPRTIRLGWWYPTLDAEGSATRYANILLRHEAFHDATPALDEPAPVVVFSHGNGGFAEQNYTMGEFFARHGWVFVAVDHTGNTFLDMSVPGYLLFELRPLDVKATLDYLDALPADHPLAGGLTAQRALTGHSFGGYTTLAVGGAGFDVEGLLADCAPGPDRPAEACDYLEEGADRYRAGFGDDRLQALVPLAPAGANLFRGGEGDIAAPVLLMTGARDKTLPNADEGDPIWDAIHQPDSVRLDFPEAGHFTFSDACALAGAVGQDDGCGPDFIPASDAYRLMNGYALAFLRLYVLGEDTDVDLLYGDATLGEGADRSLKR